MVWFVYGRKAAGNCIVPPPLVERPHTVSSMTFRLRRRWGQRLPTGPANGLEMSRPDALGYAPPLHFTATSQPSPIDVLGNGPGRVSNIEVFGRSESQVMDITLVILCNDR